MNTSLKWIEALVPGLNVDAQEYTDAMILSGSKVEFYKKMDADLEKIVVGQIKKIEPHPDADKLIICQVDVGTGEDIQIVTGAPNVKEGDKVPVVLDGGRVAGGHDGKMTEGGKRSAHRRAHSGGRDVRARVGRRIPGHLRPRRGSGPPVRGGGRDGQRHPRPLRRHHGTEHVRPADGALHV